MSTLPDIQHRLDDLERVNLQLVRDLREMDQLVYQMQTSGSPDQLRSAIIRAWAITEERMKRESKRIETLMIPEIRKAYNNNPISPAEAQRLLPKE